MMRSESKHRRAALAQLIGSFALVLGATASAQYTYDPAADDERVPSIRYYGSAKDDKGSLLPGVSIEIDSPDSVYVFVTDEQGRFHANLPLGTVAEKVTAKCFRTGLQQVRVTKRPGPRGPRPTVQVDCVLRRMTSG
jgi:hypothetical protein